MHPTKYSPHTLAVILRHWRSYLDGPNAQVATVRTAIAFFYTRVRQLSGLDEEQKWALANIGDDMHSKERAVEVFGELKSDPGAALRRMRERLTQFSRTISDPIFPLTLEQMEEIREESLALQSDLADLSSTVDRLSAVTL